MENQETKNLEWRTHTPRLLGEVLNNESCAILYRPIQILALQLQAVAQRASELNDPVLNKLMCQLTLYGVADPDHEDYDPEILKQVMAAADAVSRETNGEKNVDDIENK